MTLSPFQIVSIMSAPEFESGLLWSLCQCRLLIVEEWLPFAIGADNVSFSSDAQLFAKQLWHRDDKRKDYQETHDDEGEDPLQRNDMCRQLGQC